MKFTGEILMIYKIIHRILMICLSILLIGLLAGCGYWSNSGGYSNWGYSGGGGGYSGHGDGYSGGGGYESHYLQLQ